MARGIRWHSALTYEIICYVRPLLLCYTTTLRARLSKVARARLAAGKVPAAEVGVGRERGLVGLGLGLGLGFG